MRKFGTDKPDLMEFQIGDSDKVYTMPLAASLPAKLLVEMGEIGDNDTDYSNNQYSQMNYANQKSFNPISNNNAFSK